MRVQQVGLQTAADPTVLAFAGQEGRIVVSKDKATMIDFARDRIEKDERMPGLLVIRRAFLRGNSGLGTIINELCLINAITVSSEWENVIRFIPFPDKFPPN